MGFSCVLYSLESLVFLLVLRWCNDECINKLLGWFLVVETGLSGNKFGKFQRSILRW